MNDNDLKELHQENKHEIQALRSELNNITKKMGELDKILSDSNIENHKIKHDVAQISNNQKGLLDLYKEMMQDFKDNGNKLEEIKESLLSAQYERRLGEVEAFKKQFESIATMDTVRLLVNEVPINTKFRTKMDSIWLTILGAGTIIGTIAAFLALFKHYA